MTISQGKAGRRQSAVRRARRPKAARSPATTFRLGEDGIPMRAAPGPLARRFEQICASIIAEALAGADIVRVEFAALVFVADVPGIEQWRLAEATGIDRNTASLIADSLERKGFVERRINGGDRRARELHITEKGQTGVRSADAQGTRRQRAHPCAALGSRTGALHRPPGQVDRGQQQSCPARRGSAEAPVGSSERLCSPMILSLQGFGRRRAFASVRPWRHRCASITTL